MNYVCPTGIYLESHTAATSAYEKAVENYLKKTTSMLATVDKYSTADDFINALNDIIAQEILSEETLSMEKQAYDILNDIYYSVTHSSKWKEDVSKKLKDTTDFDKEKLKNEYKNVVNRVRTYIQNDVSNLKWFNNKIKGEPSEVASLLTGYLAKQMIRIVDINNYYSGMDFSMTPYKNAIKGYYAELATAKACEEFAKTITWNAQLLGSERNESGQLIKIDILLYGNNTKNSLDEGALTGELSKIYDSLGKTGVYTGKIDMSSKDYIGILSKSWYLQSIYEGRGKKKTEVMRIASGNDNYNDVTPSQHWVVGSQAGILNKLNNKYSWHEGLESIAEHIDSVIGNNIIYTLSNGAAWTSEIILYMQTAQYWLAFHFYTEKETKELYVTPSVEWQREGRAKNYQYNI